MSRLLTTILSITLTVAAVGAEPGGGPAVAVLDFTLPVTDSNRWAWAGGGLADLLQIELEHLGLVTLDRDLIHAVLAEQRLAADSLTAPGQLKLAALLNAQHLVAGRVIPLSDGRVRVEASAFSVEAVETVVTAASEGAFPKELPDLVRSIARTLADKLKAPGTTGANLPTSTPAFKPEALIMFYRGLNACARGQPELGIACFMNAENLDPDFAAPLLWESRGLEMAGFADLAAIQREETAEILKRHGLDHAGLTGAAARPAKPVLAVLAPVVTGDASLAVSNSFGSSLKEALLASGRVHLFAFENIGDAVAEQDLWLSSLFASEHAPRYGRWLASDALLSCRVNYSATNQVELELTLLNPLNAATLARLHKTIAAKELSVRLRLAAVEVLDQWAGRASALPASEQRDVRVDEAAAAELRPGFRELVLALAQVRRDPQNSHFHRALADIFGATGRPRLAAREIERCIATLDIHAPTADAEFLDTHVWLYSRLYSQPPSPAVGCGALEFVDRRYITNLIQPVLSVYPESVAAGCFHYGLAHEAWEGTNWLKAVEHARLSRHILKARGERGLAAADYFIEGSSLRHLARYEEAKAVLHRGQDFMERSGGFVGFWFPYGPFLSEWGGGAPLRTLFGRELVLLEGKPCRAPGLDLKLDAEDIVSATNAPTRTQEEWVQCAEQVLGILEQVPAGQPEVVQRVLGSANACLGSARSKGADAARLRPLVQRFAATLLAKRGIPSFENSRMASLAEVSEAAVEVMSLYETTGLKEEGWVVLEPLFSDRYPAALTLNLLLQLHWDVQRYPSKLKQAIARLPAGDTNIAGSTWLKLGQVYYENERYAEALDCYQRAVAKHIPLEQCPGLRSALVEVALDRNPSHPVEEIEATRRQLGFPLVEASVVEWFSAGRNYQAGRQYDLEKAVVCYRQAIEFLEHPERGGYYHLEKVPGYAGPALRWGPTLQEWDLLWSANYDARWYSSAFYLAQCLIEVNRKEEAAKWLRRIALELGGDDMSPLTGMGWHGWGTVWSGTEPFSLAPRAAELLKELHLDPGLPTFGEADGPYKLPPRSLRGRPVSAPPPPAPKPEVAEALTNALVGFPRNARSWVPQPQVQELVRRYGHDVVPAVLVLVPRAGELWDEPTLAWLLDQAAVPADAPWVIAACVKHWGLIRVAWKLDPPAAAEALAQEWEAQSRAGFVHINFISAVLDARVRPLYPLVMEHIAQKKVNHHAVIFYMDGVVAAEKSDELEAAFREALSQCLKLKLQQKEYYELPRISQIALRHGVPEAIRGMLVLEGSTPAQLLQDLRLFMDLPTQENEAVEQVRANAAKWEWDPKRKKFTLPAPNT